MKYLSIDLEATGLREHDLIIEFALVPFCTKKGLEDSLARTWYIKCPSFETLRPNLDQWVIEHNEAIIKKAHKSGITLDELRFKIEEYMNSKDVKKYFSDQKEKVILFGKSLNAIDLPFLTRDLGWKFMREHFHHRVLDLSSTANTLVDMDLIPVECTSGSGLMDYLGMGEVAHTALEDAKNTAIMYLKLIEYLGPLSAQLKD